MSNYLTFQGNRITFGGNYLTYTEPPPEAGFLLCGIVIIKGDPLIIVNNSLRANSYIWKLNGELISTALIPIIDTGLLAFGDYALELTAIGDSGTAVISHPFRITRYDEVPPSDVSNLTVSAALAIDSDSATDNKGVAGYITERQINGGDWVTLTPRTKTFTDRENLPQIGATLKYRRLAFDAAGNLSANYSNVVTLTEPDFTSPSLNITAPAANAKVKDTIALQSSAADNVGIIGVAFYIDGNLIGAEDTSAPFSVSYDTTPLATGKHTLEARARDAAGNLTIKSIVIEKLPPAPTAAFSVPASIYVGEPLTVTNQTTGIATQYEWDFESDSVPDSIAATPTNCVFHTPGTKTIKLTAGNLGGSNSVTHTITVLESFLAQHFEEFQLTKVFNITNLNLKMPLLEANFGAGYSRGVLTGPASGLRVWSISSELVPDIDQYQVSYTVDDENFTDTRFQYVWEFFRRHIALGNKPFYFTDPRTQRRFLASFVESQISFESMTAKLFRGGLLIRQRRCKLDGLTFRAQDASIEQY